MTEDQIEAKVERFIDHIDRLFLAGQMSQKDYDAAARDIEVWADGKLAEAAEIADTLAAYEALATFESDREAREQDELKHKHNVARAHRH